MGREHKKDYKHIAKIQPQPQLKPLKSMSANIKKPNTNPHKSECKRKKKHQFFQTLKEPRNKEEAQLVTAIQH